MSMALHQKLSLRLSQRLIMTPALQQAIKLLQMSTLELREEITTELEKNPALEEFMESESAEDYEATTSDEGPSAGEDQDRNSLDEVDLGYMLQNYYEGGPTLPRGSLETREDTTGWEANLSRPEDLSTYLLRQLGLATSDPVLQEIGGEIIGNVDANGYLQANLEELMAMGDHSPQDVERALDLVQGLDPPGVAARNLPECLLAQLRQRGLGDSPAAIIIRECLNTDLENLRAHMEVLRSLQPRPGERLFPKPSIAVTPDVVVIKMGDDYQVLLNDDGLPRLRVSKYCRSILKTGTSASREDREFVRSKLSAAVRFIKSIHERQRTIYKVACSIVAHQRDFLDHGLNYIRPMVLRNVAEDVRIHESTVSRVVNNKYMHIPNGVFEMRFFFHSGLATTYGEEISSLAIKEKIRLAIGKEDPRRPLSDSTIAKRLKEEEYLPIARRTVAKYRGELRIPASTVRRRSLSQGRQK
jgi:RNA polymerase sigma-54 factor